MTTEILYDFGANSVVPANMVDESDGQYTLLDPGEYSYTVIGFKRVRMDKETSKIPKGAWGAEVTLLVKAPNGQTTTLRKTFWLVQSCSWISGKFLKSCGLRKTGEQINFALLETAKQRAATGRLILKHRQGTGKFADRMYNEVDEFLEPDQESDKQEQAEDEELIPF